MSSSDYYWCINNSVDTTTKTTNCAYDRIITTNPAPPDFTGDADVFRFDIEYELTVDETTAVSDHYLVYAEFRWNRDTDSTPVIDGDRGRDRFDGRHGGAVRHNRTCLKPCAQESLQGSWL